MNAFWEISPGNRHLGQMPPKPVAGLPTHLVNDKGRYRQQSAMAIFTPQPRLQNACFRASRA
jgi:hypothetical protein